MKILFGRPRLEYCTCENGVPTGDWIEIDTPKEDTTSLETVDGDDLEATEEGGDMLERLSEACSYTLTFELFKKKGEAFPLSDKDSHGIVSGEYAIRLTSEIDSEVPGFQIDRASVKTARLYSPSETYRKQFKFMALKPASGETIKEVENTLVQFTYESGIKTVSVLNYGNLTIDYSEDWLEVIADGRNVIITVDENEVKEPRTAYVTITDTVGEVTTLMTIEQAKCPNFLMTLTGGLLLTASGNRIKLRT